MTNHDELARAPEPADARTSSLIAAVLRLNVSLDLATVLQEAVDSACALTNARYSLLVTIDETGATREFVTAGLTPDEHRELAEWPDGPRLFAYLRDLPGSFRLADLPDYFRALGFSDELVREKTLQGTPMRHRGVQVGNFFLAGKKGASKFTAADEEMLELFAAQAAAAIVNARAYRDERRARADLEALIDTSPVGVVVFDVQTGRPVSLNREAKRLAGSLHQPGQPPEALLKVLTCRRADGREIVLEQFPLEQELQSATPVRGEEIVLSVPDGRCVTALLNATPIHAEDGAVASIVVTLQDLAPFEELARLRVEFLGMVSHELRAPLTSIKGSAATLLETASDLDPAERREFFRIIADQADHMRSLIGDLLDVGRIDAGTLSVSLESSEVATLVDRARTTFLSGGGRHRVLLDLPPDLPRVLADRQRLVQVLNNLLANAARHAPATSPIRIAVTHDGVHVTVSVTDEGQGIAPDQLPYLFRKYAAKEGVTGGLGLAICKGLVEAHGGRIRAESGGLGLGTRVTFTIPVVEASAVPAPPSQLKVPLDGGEPTRILVVDDDPQMLRYIRDELTVAGYAALVTGDHQELAHIIETEQPALVLLDLVLPGTDGLALMERVPELADRPVIFISGYGHDETIARAFEAGADDYLVKPFSPTELVARIRAALRRRAAPDPFVLGDLAIDYNRRQVCVAGRAVALTVYEYELLRVLSLGAGRILTYNALLRQVWSGRIYTDPHRLVRAFVKQLRRKLGDDAETPAYIVTVRGVGYRMKQAGDA